MRLRPKCASSRSVRLYGRDLNGTAGQRRTLPLSIGRTRSTLRKLRVGTSVRGLVVAELRPVLSLVGTAGPSGTKWPDTKEEISRIYQDGAPRCVRFLGWGSHCDKLFENDIPPNWQVMAFNAVPPSEFLRSIDAFVYYHHTNWVEGFGRTTLEAIAARVPCILAPDFAETFGGAALYATPAQVTRFLQKS